MGKTTQYLMTGLVVLLGWLTASAQVPINVQGTVTNTEGDPQEGVEIWVTGHMPGDSSVFFTNAFTDAEGNYFTSLTFPAEDPGSFVEVTMVDCFGLLQTQSFPTGNGTTEIEADFIYCAGITFDSCAVWIVQDGQPPFFVQLTALTPPVSGVEYLWSTGETSQSIVPQASGTYCVTASFPFGCDTTACIEVVLDSLGWCPGYIVSYPNGDGTYNLEAISLGQSPFTYLWDNGSGDAVIDSVGPGTYCVTITDATGCTFSTCYFVDDNTFCDAFISEDPAGGLTVFGFGQEPFTYAWTTGENTQTIFPGQPGLYCVTVTDATGCEAPTCIETGGGWDSCFVYVAVFYGDTNQIGLEAVTSSFAPPYTYLWNTGDTTSTLFPVDPSQQYCVTVTDSNGCVAEGCFEPTHFCYAWVDVVYLDTNQAVLTAYTDPIFNLPGGQTPTYLWSNGETGPSITVDTSGDYCVTVSLAAGCSVESCGHVDFESLGSECYAWIQQYPDSSGGWHADVQTWGWGTFSYQWSTGDTTSSIELMPGELACVTVTSSFGCETFACTDTISPCQPVINQFYVGPNHVELSAWVWNDPNQIGQYVWSTGESSQTITVTEEGTYCVTVSAGGCIGEACTTVYFTIPDSCGVTIVTSPDPLGTLFTAVPWGEPPFTYQWSNGVTDESFVVDFGPLDYCVTVTDATGCVAMTCTPANDSCWVALNYSNQNGNIIYAEGSDPASIMVWSTGDTLTNWIEIEAPGTYCATMITFAGCVATSCITVDSLNPEMGNVITGFVFGDTLAAIDASVYAYRLVDNTNDEYVLYASADADAQGFYMLTNLPDGLYLLRAEGTPGTSTAADYVPTYHYDAASWEDAQPHILPNFLPVTTDIRMIRDTDLTGGGVIGGALFDPEGLVAGEELDLRGFGGLGGIVILLKNTDGHPLQYVHSEDDGTFRFENLPYGTYRLAYDLPGYHSPDVWVTISPDEPEKLEVNLPISGITAVEDGQQLQVTVYPNPARDALYIPVPGIDEACEVRMTDIQGRTVFAGSMLPQAGILQMNVSDFAPGLYQVQVYGRQVHYLGRWIRQD